MLKLRTLLTACFLLAVAFSLHSQTTNNLQLPTSINSDGTAPDNSAILDVQSTNKGLLAPRMTTAQRTAIATPADGLLVFDTDENSFFYSENGNWHRLGLPTDGELDEVLKSDASGQASWQPLFPSTFAADPNPLQTGSIDLIEYPRVAVQDEFAYVTTSSPGRLNIVDVSKPATPSLSGTISIGSDPTDPAVQGNYVYVVDKSTDTLKVIEVTDPVNPSLSGSLGLGSTSSQVVVQGNYAYLLDDDLDELRIIDVSDPASPTSSGSLALGSSSRAIAVEGNYAYVVDSNSDQLMVIDVSDPANPGNSGSLNLSVSPRDIAVQGNYAYVVGLGVNALEIIDISNPASPMFSNSLNIGTGVSSEVEVQGNYVYLTENNTYQLKVVEMSDPTNPVISGSVNIDPTSLSLAIAGNYAYVTYESGGDLKIYQLGAAAVGTGVNGELTVFTEADGDPTNELITSAILNGTDLEITDVGGTNTVDLSSLVTVETDPQVGVNITNHLSKWNGSALVASTSVEEDGTGHVGVNQMHGSVAFNVRAISGENQTFRVEDATGAERFRVLGDGHAGVNQTYNNVALNVRGKSGEVHTFRVEDAVGQERFSVHSDGHAGFNHIYGNEALNVRGLSGETGVFRVEDAAGTERFRVLNDGHVGVNQVHGSVAFNVRGISGENQTFRVEDAAGTERFRVLGDGHTGVNNTYTDVALNVRGNSGEVLAFRVEDSAGTARLRVENGGHAGFNWSYNNVALNVRGNSGEELVFRVEDAAGTERLRILNDGHSGFNTVFNDVTLNVRGNTGDFRYFLVEEPNGDNLLEVNGDGDVNVINWLTKGGGSFKIDHPLDPENKYLYHSFVESPDMMNVYNGNVTTDGSGFATVELPDYFEALNRDFRYQLTVIGTFAQAIVKEEVVDNHFIIQTNEPNVKVSWQVTGIRKDPFAEEYRIPESVDKAPREKGFYLHPEAYGQPTSKGIGSLDDK